jgi:predicted nicotinamide N-methyase
MPALLPARDESYLRLLGRVQRTVPVEHIQTEIAGQSYPWTRVIDPDRLLEDALSRRDRSPADLDPFWAATWRAAIGLDRFLSRLELRDLRVLELGCGSGRAGIAAALRGARVTLTDAAGQALLVARLNAWPVRGQLRVRSLNWDGTGLPDPPFPLILGSDLVYDQSLWAMLESCLRRHLTDEGLVLLSEPQRHTGDRFETWIGQAGWKTRVTLVDLDDGKPSIRVFQLRR